MDQPEGFVVPGKENLVCRLKKSLYGSKQSPRQWYKKFDSFMLSHSFKRSDYDSYVYLKTVNGSAIYLLLYVDDMLIAAKDKSEVAKLKAQLSKEFEMKNLGAAKKIFGVEIIRDRKSCMLYLSRRAYIEKVLRCFNMHDAKPMSTPLLHILDYLQLYVWCQMMILSTYLEFHIRVQLVLLCMPWSVLVLIYLMH
jgi:hypothetical protein